MKRTLIFLFLLGWAAVAAFGEDRYVLRLKSGGKVITNRYWEEKGQIKCQKGDMVVGFKKESVLSIEKISSPGESSDDKASGDTAAAPASAPATEKTVAEPGTSADASASTSTTGDDPKALQAAYLGKRDVLQSKIDGALERFHQASAAGDKEGKQRILDEVNGLSKQVYDMEEELKTRNKGTLPAWWKPEKKSPPQN